MLLLLALSTESVLEGACIYECIYECVHECVWARVWGFVGLEETLPCVHTKALCLRRGNDTLAEQKKLKTMLASVPCWSYDTGKKRGVSELHRYQRIDTTACSSGADSVCRCSTCLNLFISRLKKFSGSTSACMFNFYFFLLVRNTICLYVSFL